jgi:hypothetical protein
MTVRKFYDPPPAFHTQNPIQKGGFRQGQHPSDPALLAVPWLIFHSNHLIGVSQKNLLQSIVLQPISMVVVIKDCYNSNFHKKYLLFVFPVQASSSTVSWAQPRSGYTLD